jgi:hypothetical protein
MKPAADIHKLIKKLQVVPNADMDKRVHDRITRALEGWESSKGISWRDSEPSIGRLIMKSKIAQTAAAAVIIIACLTGLILWKGTGADVALADVLTRIENITGYSYQMNSTIKRQEATSKWTSHILVSKEDGIKMKITAAEPNNVQNQPRQYRHEVGDETYLLPKQKALVFVKHKAKTYDRYIYENQKLEYYKEEYNEPRTIIKQILSCKHTSIGQSVIDDIMVEGFQTTDIAYQGGFFGQAELEGEHKTVDVKLWVDVDTFLPVRLEEDIVTKKGLHMHEVSYNFRWNVIVNADDFKPHIPDDYRAPTGDIVIPGFDEQNVIQGLKLFAAAVGSYPVNLETAGQEFRLKSGFDPNSFKDMSDEERTRKTSEVVLMAAVPNLFYKSLVEQSKEPAYYGESVGPDDKNKVLLRWKLDDDRYRVICGDLSAKTVTTEELTKLEAGKQ